MANTKINPFLPPEIWDLILEFLPIRELEKIKLLSFFFYNLIDLNRGFKCKILLCKKGQGNYKITSQFQWAANYGHLEVLRWLHSTFKITEENAKSYNNYAFRFAAWNGHLTTLRWLYSTFELTGENARSRDNYAFQSAASGGHLEILKWLHSTFNLTSEDARNCGNLAFQWAASNGHLHVLRWLHSTFELTEKDAKSHDYCAFQWAAGNGHLKVLKWLHSTFEITNEESMALYHRKGRLNVNTLGKKWEFDFASAASSHLLNYTY